MRKIWLLCLFMLSACAGPTHATPAPTPVILDVTLTPSLQPLAETLHACAAPHPEFVINVMKHQYQLSKTNRLIWLSVGGITGDGFAAPIGAEALVLIVNAGNQVLTIQKKKSGYLYRPYNSWGRWGRATACTSMDLS